MGGAPAKKKSAFTKAASSPARQKSENVTQGFWDFFFDAAPRLEYVFQLFELSTEASFAKAAFDTLHEKSNNAETREKVANRVKLRNRKQPHLKNMATRKTMRKWSQTKLSLRRNKRVVFTGGSFRKGVRVPIGVPGGGVWGRVQGGGRG